MPSVIAAPSVRLTKHHGLGNDFLVLLDVDGRHRDLDRSRLAARACDRHRGVGADGLLAAAAGSDGADITMSLYNADGSRAEMSGNGIRCLVQAVLDAGLVDGDRVVVATDAGPRQVECVDRPRPGLMSLRVDMGPAVLKGEDARWQTGKVQATALVDTGNPHLVLLDPTMADIDIATEGRRIEEAFPEGINVEWIFPGPGPDELTLRVWERGAGATDACGTGSCAAATAAHSWGRVGSRVVVHNPGGDLIVDVGETAVLTGPAVFVATVDYPWH
jgi:diaminopimelate epimerase